jgi:hypothetical protein
MMGKGWCRPIIPAVAAMSSGYRMIHEQDESSRASTVSGHCVESGPLRDFPAGEDRDGRDPSRSGRRFLPAGTSEIRSNRAERTQSS